MISHKYNEDYFEHGVKKGISGYENYSWMPHRSFSEAVTIIKELSFDSCIDYGCAKGFLVHALNQLNKKTIGVDISEYAIKNCHPKVTDKLFVLDKTLSNMNLKTDLLIAKDILEHVPENDVVDLLKDFKTICKRGFFVIPLGDNDMFRIREYEIDETHITKKDEDWWIDKIKESGFILEKFDYNMGNIKSKWINQNPYGNGFFVVKS